MGELMRDPVTCTDGHSYERANISRWLNEGHNTSPITGNPLQSNLLIPNHALRNAIEDWEDEQAKRRLARPPSLSSPIGASTLVVASATAADHADAATPPAPASTAADVCASSTMPAAAMTPDLVPHAGDAAAAAAGSGGRARAAAGPDDGPLPCLATGMAVLYTQALSLIHI